MHALTVKQPWAEAIARHGKNVENRSRRPPAHLIGQRIAIHAGQTVCDAAVRACHRPPEIVDHLEQMLVWLMQHDLDRMGKDWDPRLGPQPTIPDAGRIIATARLVGWVKGDGFLPEEYLYCHRDMRETVEAAIDSPWRTGQGVGWVLADVVTLPETVGQPSRDRTGVESIRGQVYPFALSPDVEAEVLRQEASAKAVK